MPNTAGNWPFTYPDGTTPLTPLRQRFQQLAQSVADALTGNKVVVLVTDATDRATKFPSPTQGDVVYRADLGWREIYFGLYNSGTNPGGAVAAGWYPEAGALIRGRAYRGTDSNISSAISPRTALTVAWDSTFVRGGMTNSGTSGIVAPYAGEYDIMYEVSFASNASGTRLMSLFKNGVEITESLIAIAASPSSTTYMTARRVLTLAAGDVITVGAAQNSGGTLAATSASSGVAMWWKGKG